MKEEKIEFVRGHFGTDLLEVCALMSVLPLIYFTWYLINILTTPSHISGKKIEKPPITSTSFLVEVFKESAFLTLPIVLVVTALSNYLYHVLLLILTLNFIIFMKLGWRFMNHQLKDILIQMSNKLYSHERRFICVFKGFLLIVTAVCILAVDFHIFPRRYAKAEDFGLGFMDAGVGAFIISNGAVSSYARYKHDHYDNIKVFKKNFLSSLPLIVLGLVRTISVSLSDYHIHVTEYGVHWNFFLSLAAAKLFSSFIFVIFPFKFAFLLGLMLGICYESTLRLTSLELYVLEEGPRSGLFSANKEGIVSSIGYVSLYLLSVGLGQYLFEARDRLGEWLRVLLYLVLISSVILVVLPLCGLIGTSTISRRLFNLPYITCALGVACALMAAYLAIELTFSVLQTVRKTRGKLDKLTHVAYIDPPPLLMAIRENGLFYFLVGNVLTGCVNMCINTLHMSDPGAVTIITTYMLTLNIITKFIYWKNIKMKWW